jgi:hypothetical protein
MARLSLLHRFSLLSMFAVIVVNVVFSWTISHALYRHALDNAKELTANIVLSESRAEFTRAERRSSTTTKRSAARSTT